MVRNTLLVAGAATGLSVLALVGSGLAAADSTSQSVIGKKYSDAQTAITGAGYTPVVQNVIGDQNSWPNCLVTKAQKRTVPAPANSNGSATTQVLVALNCENGVATATKPGASMGSPEGRAAAAAAAQAAQGSGSS